MELLKQGGMIAVLALLSEGLCLLYSALVQRTGTESGFRFGELFAGAVLCSSGFALLYSLGSRDEK